MTADTLRLLLDDEEPTTQLATVAQQLANAQVPTSIAAAIGFGRVVALQKNNGRVRGIIIGDVLRRLVARSLAQQHATAIHTTCAPRQFALSTRAGTEAVVRAISVATQSNPQHTVLSVDGIGAYDTISRHSMLHGLMNVPIVNRCLPFVRMFYGQASQYIWHDHTGHPHLISQGEGGEQGDPLMPALFSLGQRAALQAIQEQLHPNELLLAYLDDVYAVVPPPEFAKSMTSWPTNFTGTRTSNSIVAKPACGMLPAPSPPTWHLWDQMCGSAAQPYPATSKDSQSSALP